MEDLFVKLIIIIVGFTIGRIIGRILIVYFDKLKEKIQNKKSKDYTRNTHNEEL